MKSKPFYALCLLAQFLVGILSAQEQHTQANAANPTNEGNSVGGWGGSTSNTVVTDEVYSGNYAIKLEAATDGWKNAQYTFTTVPGERYRIIIYAKSGTPVRQGFYIWEGFTDFTAIDNIAQEWTEYTWMLTASGTSGLIKIYTGHPSVAGNTVYIDNVSIMREDLQVPTAPTLSSIGRTDTTVDLSWGGATDNIGVTGYKIYKGGELETTLGNVGTYQVTGLAAGTSYNFSVRTMDAYGNESSSSNTVSVTTNGLGGTVWNTSGNDINYTLGNVSVGTTTVPTGYRMAVDGKLIAEEVKVRLSGDWPDYVFKKGYDLPTLEEIQRHIREKGHLPNIPSAREVKANGIELGEMDRLLLEKIEEQILYILQLEKRIKQLENR